MRRSPQYIEKNRECDRARVGASETEQGNMKGKGGGERTCMERILDLYFHMEYVSWFATARISNFSHTHVHARTQLLNFHLHVCVFL